MNRMFPALGASLAAGAILFGTACSDVQTANTPTQQPAAQQQQQSRPTTTVSTQPGAAMSAADVVKLAEPSVVRIATSGGVGSGFVVDEAGYIITNNHVVQARGGRSAATVEVTMSDGTVLQGSVVGTDPRADLAVVKVEASGKLSALKLANLDDVAVGQDVLAIGYALDLKGGEGPSYSVTRGIISQKNRAISEDSNILGAVQTDAAINHGNSGGPLLTMDGEVVGVNTSLQPDASSASGVAAGIGYAVGSDTVRAVYEQIRTSGSVDRGLLGVASFTSLRPAKAKELGLAEDTEGVYLGDPNSVAPGGPAAKAGLQVGDVITKIGDIPVQDEGDLAVAMIKSRPGEKVAVQIYRGGKLQTVEVTLGTPAQQ